MEMQMSDIAVKNQIKNKRQKAKAKLQCINPNVAGIDIGSRFHFVAVGAEFDEQPVRRFSSFTNDLYCLADWLQKCGVKSVAMESTGVYWIPLYDILESRGFEVLLVNARHIKNVPGRKSDVQDCQWLQQLHSYGLVRGSFRPREDITTLRTYLRHREMLVKCAASHVQHMQKALMQMNVQLHHVISDITGQTGMRIIEGIINGTHDPKELVKYRDERCHASEDKIAEALTGHYRSEHIFSLKQAWQLYKIYQQQISECDQQIAKVLDDLRSHGPKSGQNPPKPRQKERYNNNQPRIDIRGPLYEMTGEDLTQIDGIGSHTALRIISEIGYDMSRWPSAEHFTAWACLTPRNKITGGRIISSKTLPSANRVAALLRMAAQSVGRTQTALGAFYRRLAVRIGKAKAITATARKIGMHVYRVLANGLQYNDIGADAYDCKFKKRVLINMQRRAKNLGFKLVPIENYCVTEVVS
jgi:transposase